MINILIYFLFSSGKLLSVYLALIMLVKSNYFYILFFSFQSILLGKTSTVKAIEGGIEIYIHIFVFVLIF